METSLLCILVNDSMSADTYYLNIMSFWILLAANRRHIRNTHTKNICRVTGSLEEGRAGRGTRLLGGTSPRSASLGPVSVSQGAAQPGGARRAVNAECLSAQSQKVQA